MVRLARDDDEWGFLREPCSNSINGKEMLQVSFFSGRSAGEE